MQKPESFYEIELKSLLTKEKYQQLLSELPKKLKVINKETIHTTRYRPGDVRLRHSDKTIEIVCKEGDVTQISRKEIKIPLVSKEKLSYFSQIFDMLGFKPDPPWLKHKEEYIYKFKDFDYVVCIQHIENFAYILEVEFLSQTNNAEIHEPNLKEIIRELGCEPINPAEFSEKIKDYIKENKVN